MYLYKIQKRVVGEFFQPVLQRVQINVIFAVNIGRYIVFILQCQKIHTQKKNASLSIQERQQRTSNRFHLRPLSRPLLYRYPFLPLTLHELESRKVIFCSMNVNTSNKKYSQHNLTAQIEPVHDKLLLYVKRRICTTQLKSTISCEAHRVFPTTHPFKFITCNLFS